MNYDDDYDNNIDAIPDSLKFSDVSSVESGEENKVDHKDDDAS